MKIEMKEVLPEPIHLDQSEISRLQTNHADALSPKSIQVEDELNVIAGHTQSEMTHHVGKLIWRGAYDGRPNAGLDEWILRVQKLRNQPSEKKSAQILIQLAQILRPSEVQLQFYRMVFDHLKTSDEQFTHQQHNEFKRMCAEDLLTDLFPTISESKRELLLNEYMQQGFGGMPDLERMSIGLYLKQYYPDEVFSFDGIHDVLHFDAQSYHDYRLFMKRLERKNREFEAWDRNVRTKKKKKKRIRKRHQARVVIQTKERNIAREWLQRDIQVYAEKTGRMPDSSHNNSLEEYDFPELKQALEAVPEQFWINTPITKREAERMLLIFITGDYSLGPASFFWSRAKKSPDPDTQKNWLDALLRFYLQRCNYAHCNELIKIWSEIGYPELGRLHVTRVTTTPFERGIEWLLSWLEK